MPRRPVFAADTPAAFLRDYIVRAISEVFTVNRVLPLMRRPPAEPEPPLPVLFEDLPNQRKGEPAIVAPAPAPQPAVSLDPRDYPNAALMARIMGDALPPPSALSVARRRKARERAEAAATAAREVEVALVEPASDPAPFLTMDMGRWMKAHDKDRIDFEPRIGHPHRVACPPFHLHDEDHTDPVDQFLGQVVGVEPARALLFRRRDPDFLDGCEVGQRYVLLRFWDDEGGQVWSMPVDGEDDPAVLEAISRTTALYRWSKRGSPQI